MTSILDLPQRYHPPRTRIECLSPPGEEIRILEMAIAFAYYTVPPQLDKCRWIDNPRLSPIG